VERAVEVVEPVEQAERVAERVEEERHRERRVEREGIRPPVTAVTPPLPGDEDTGCEEGR
jgi:hypothetical protein